MTTWRPALFAALPILAAPLIAQQERDLNVEVQAGAFVPTTDVGTSFGYRGRHTVQPIIGATVLYKTDRRSPIGLAVTFGTSVRSGIGLTPTTGCRGTCTPFVGRYGRVRFGFGSVWTEVGDAMTRARFSVGGGLRDLANADYACVCEPGDPQIGDLLDEASRMAGLFGGAIERRVGPIWAIGRVDLMVSRSDLRVLQRDLLLALGVRVPLIAPRQQSGQPAKRTRRHHRTASRQARRRRRITRTKGR